MSGKEQHGNIVSRKQLGFKNQENKEITKIDL